MTTRKTAARSASAKTTASRKPSTRKAAATPDTLAAKSPAKAATKSAKTKTPVAKSAAVEAAGSKSVGPDSLKDALLASEIAQEARDLVDHEDIDATLSGARLGVMGVTRPMTVPVADEKDESACGATDTPASAGSDSDGKLVKKDLIDRVIARSGVKPLKVQRRKDVDDGEVIICKLKRKKSEPEGNDPLATAAE